MVTLVFLFRQQAVFILLRISYLWYTVIGMLIVLVLGALVSLLTNALNTVSRSIDMPAEQLRDRTVIRKLSTADEVSK